jgi:hypothetical protein
LTLAFLVLTPGGALARRSYRSVIAWKSGPRHAAVLVAPQPFTRA